MIRLRGLVIIDKRKAARKALFRALFNVQGEWSEVVSTRPECTSM